MKRFVLGLSFGLVGIVLGGCPIYSDDGGRRVCNGDGCWDCPRDYFSYDRCSPWICESSSECPSGYTCDGNRCVYDEAPPYDSGVPATCVTPNDCASGYNCGTDNRCHPGDCASSGCPGGFTCKLSGGAPQCVATGSGGDAGTDGGPGGCDSDSACTGKGTGAKCINGACVAAGDLCSDTTQCSNGAACVDGACTPRCDGSHACPTGYGCDAARGVCTVNPAPCTPSSCGVGLACSDQRCVPSCTTSCSDGLVCVHGGCVVDEAPRHLCGADGEVGDGTAGKCALGNICIHHACYAACEVGDGGESVCSGKYNLCKPVTASATYDVCGSSANLGSDCDPTRALACSAGTICIDGFCK